MFSKNHILLSHLQESTKSFSKSISKIIKQFTSEIPKNVKIKKEDIIHVVDIFDGEKDIINPQIVLKNLKLVFEEYQNYYQLFYKEMEEEVENEMKELYENSATDEIKKQHQIVDSEISCFNINLINTVCETTITELLVSSKTTPMNEMKQYLREVLPNKNNIVFLIETIDNQFIGVYIDSIITKPIGKVKGNKSFFFGFHTVGNKVDIQTKESVLELFDDDSIYLLVFGDNELSIVDMEDGFSTCQIDQCEELFNIPSYFTVKALYILQMNSQYEFQLEGENYHLKEIYQSYGSTNKYNKYEYKGISNDSSSIKFSLELLVESPVKRLVFDSLINNSLSKTNVFRNILLGRKNICIVIEDLKDNIFGGYIHDEIVSNTFMNDSRSFLFSIKREKKSYLLKCEKKDIGYSFYMNVNDEDILFCFGGIEKDDRHDICINCCQQKSITGICDYCSFDYHGYENALIDSNFFELKRLYVYELF